MIQKENSLSFTRFRKRKTKIIIFSITFSCSEFLSLPRTDTHTHLQTHKCTDACTHTYTHKYTHAHTKHSCTRLRRAHTDTRRHAQTVTHTHTRTRTHTHTGKERLKKRILCFLCVGTRVVYIFQHHGQRRFLCRS